MNMEDTEIQNFIVPLSEDEIEDTEEVNFAEIGFYFGMYAMINNVDQEIPPEVGRIAAYLQLGRYVDGVWIEEREDLKLKNCSDVVPAEHLAR